MHFFTILENLKQKLLMKKSWIFSFLLQVWNYWAHCKNELCLDSGQSKQHKRWCLHNCKKIIWNYIIAKVKNNKTLISNYGELNTKRLIDLALDDGGKGHGKWQKYV